MPVSIPEQLAQAAQALALGLILGALYFVTHLSSRVHAALDALFALSALFAVTVFFLTACGGLVRGYQLAALTIGMLGMVHLMRRMQRRKNGQKHK